MSLQHSSFFLCMFELTCDKFVEIAIQKIIFDYTESLFRLRMLRRIFSSRLSLLTRWRGLSDNLTLTEGELKLRDILKAKFPKAELIQVQDVSGGCGAMYQVNIESEDFVGKRTLQQHRMVTQALADEVKQMHGLRISTSAPADSETKSR